MEASIFYGKLPFYFGSFQFFMEFFILFWKLPFFYGIFPFYFGSLYIIMEASIKLRVLPSYPNFYETQGHKLMKFEEKNEEIRKKEKFISEVLEKKYDDDIKSKTEESHSRKSSGSNYFTETIGNLESLYELNKALRI